MMSLEEKLREIEKLFNRGSKSFQAAVEVVRKGRAITKEEKKLIAGKIGCSLKTVDYALTKLRKAGLYGSTYEVEETKETKEETKKFEEEEKPPREPKKPIPEELEKVEEPEEYVTVEDFNRFMEELKVVLGLKPIADDDVDYVEEELAPSPESIDLQHASMKQMGTWVEAKNLIYFDFAKNGAFGGALEDFDGNWSDFVNIVIDDYFRSACTRNGPCQYRMNVGLGLLSKRFA